MGTKEGLEWLGEQLEKEIVTDEAFLKRYGWAKSKEVDFWEKDGQCLYREKAIFHEIDGFLDRDGWKQLTVEVTMPACVKVGVKEPEKMAYFQSPKTGRVYQWLELIYLYYHNAAGEVLTEEQLFPEVCSEKTLDLNRLFPEIPKPEVMQVTFTIKEGYQRH